MKKIVLKKGVEINLYILTVRKPIPPHDWRYINRVEVADDWEFSESDIDATMVRSDEFTTANQQVDGYVYGPNNEYLVKLLPNEYEATHFIFNWSMVDIR